MIFSERRQTDTEEYILCFLYMKFQTIKNEAVGMEWNGNGIVVSSEGKEWDCWRPSYKYSNFYSNFIPNEDIEYIIFSLWW